MNIRLLLALAFIAFIGFSSFGQYRPQSSPSRSNNPLEKFYFGGGGSLGGGSNTFTISLSPLVGYKITEQFSVGMQLTYQYYSIKYTSTDRATINNYGGGPFLRYNITQNLFAYTQYEYLNIGLVDIRGQEFRYNFNSYFVGGGYSNPIGNGGLAINVTVLYNILYGDGTNTPYASPLQFRMGIVAGF